MYIRAKQLEVSGVVMKVLSLQGSSTLRLVAYPVSRNNQSGRRFNSTWVASFVSTISASEIRREFNVFKTCQAYLSCPFLGIISLTGALCVESPRSSFRFTILAAEIVSPLRLIYLSKHVVLELPKDLLISQSGRLSFTTMQDNYNVFHETYIMGVSL